MDIIISKGMSTGLVILFFGTIILLLRFLYGPKGILRDPEWDRWNEEAKRELEAKEARKKEVIVPATQTDGKKEAVRAQGASKRDLYPKVLEQVFMDYTDTFLSGDAEGDRHYLLKREHTLNVLANAMAIVEGEEEFADPLTGRATVVAALFHDIGRFEQYKRYRTFADGISCNHGMFGAKILRQRDFLRDEPKDVTRLVLAAVAAHNRISVPVAVRGRLLPVLRAVRDADKLDILSVLKEYLQPGVAPDPVVLLSLSEDSAAYTPSILAALEKGEAALYKDMRHINDFRILLCTWITEFSFGTSRHLLRESGNLYAIIDGLAGIPEVQARVRTIVDERLSGAC